MSEPNAKPSLPPAAQEQRLVTVSPGRPPYPVRAQAAFNISAGDWRALVDAVFPTAETTEAVELALAYCRARNLDIFKRPVHIVGIWSKSRKAVVESVWPGIGELRTTAARTGQCAGFDEAVFGPEETRTFKSEKEEKTVSFPSWCSIVVYRLVQGQRVAFPGPKVRWLETYATIGRTDVPNDMWQTRPYGQLEKCAEAAALRRAFPEEIGNDYIPEEVGRRQEPIDITPAPEPLGARSEALAERLRQGVASSAYHGLPEAMARQEAAGRALDEVQEKREEPPFDVEEQPKTRDDLVEDARALLKTHGLAAGDQRNEALQLAFGTPSWVAVTKMDPEALAVGVNALRVHLEGLAAFRNEAAPTTREPGED